AIVKRRNSSIPWLDAELGAAPPHQILHRDHASLGFVVSAICLSVTAHHLRSEQLRPYRAPAEFAFSGTPAWIAGARYALPICFRGEASRRILPPRNFAAAQHRRPDLRMDLPMGRISTVLGCWASLGVSRTAIYGAGRICTRASWRLILKDFE